MRLLILLVGCLLSFCFSQKLSPAEDEERSKTCGRIPNQNAKTNDELSPWTVRVEDMFFHAATLISKRHILSSGSIVIDKVKNEDKWKWAMNGEEIDMAKCKDNKMEVPTKYLTVDLAACSNHFLCPWRPKIPIKSAYYIGPCDAKSLPDGVVIVEMERDIPEDSEYYIPACIPGTTSPLIKRVDGVDTVVGFSIYYNDECKKKTFASVTFYKDQICEIAGICKKTSTDPYAPKQIPPPTEISLSNKFNKLTKSEDVANTESCGKPTNPGSSLPIDLTPWTVNVNTPNDNGYIYNPATLISKRHVVVAAFALFKDKPAKYFDGTAAVYFGVCEPEVQAFGVILLEMDSDIPAEFPYLVPSCIPGKATPVFEDNLHVHSIGQDKNGQYTRQISEAKTEKCTSGYLFYCQVCATRSQCNKDSSGGLSRNMNGQETLIGILYYRGPKCKNDQFVSIEMLSDLFCLYAGICAEKSSAPVTVPSIPAATGNVPVETTPSKPDPSTEKAGDQDTVTTIPADSSAEDATTQKDDKVIDQKPEDEITPEAVQPTDKPEEPDTTEPAETDGDGTTVEDNPPTEKPDEPEPTEPGDDDDDDPEEDPKEKPKEVQNPEKQVQNPRKVPRVDDEEEEEDDEEEEENEHKTTTVITSSAMISSSKIVVSLICVIFGFEI
ncbi:hypothetical protein GCK72_002682 [Caenorhabditis remanei]|uniref:Uncharacterized protein n=1 Tax=Caenorhabditis remanei TaxID=31234 RepID=A0A6A5HSG8_CAERE|nr:hypothetical protein GCK72_002682 [Caenorhabditis remanei]KAF1770858.1 hypothetical protein GCK72_002682 [Caenorhabditis remanei]